jgi:glutamate formiminotransferase / formiminotetrahydrofolate cyclodeaminase
MDKIVECVPNFSEGRDEAVINDIVRSIKSGGKINILDFSSGKAANRSVITFAGSPGDVQEAAFRGIEKAAQLIDMTKHQGEHPRFGATDVCPLIPLAGMEMEEAAELARKLSHRVGNELGIPVYCYEYAAFKSERHNLANCRSGGYEKLKSRIITELWKPDFGPAEWNSSVSRTGAVAIGARNVLVAYNVNLDTTSALIASDIASDIRESGRVRSKKDNAGLNNTGKDMPLAIPGTLPKVRALGWYIDDFGIAQVSMNLTDIDITPVHIAFEEVSRRAAELGVKVTGSELVGLIPLKAMLEAGKYYLHKHKKSALIPEEEIIKAAVNFLGLNDLYPFDPQKKIIEYVI